MERIRHPLMNNDLPILNCDGCGLCCEEMRTPPFLWLNGEKPPKHLEAEVVKAIKDRSRPQDAPCLWFDHEARQCRHYEHRPEICRDFEMGLEYCRRIRQMRAHLLPNKSLKSPNS